MCIQFFKCFTKVHFFLYLTTYTPYRYERWGQSTMQFHRYDVREIGNVK